MITVKVITDKLIPRVFVLWHNSFELLPLGEILIPFELMTIIKIRTEFICKHIS